MVMNNKGKITTKHINTAIIGLLVLVVLFKVLAAVVPLAQAEGDALGDQGQCESLGCFYNASVASECLVSEPLQNETCAGDYNAAKIPLSSLFSGSGVVFIIIMVAFLVIVVRAFMTTGKGKE